MKCVVNWLVTIVFAVGVAASTAAAADDPKPTPTPRAKSLGDVAKGVQLKGSGSADTGKKGIVINDQNLSSYASKGAVTTAKPILTAPNVASMPPLSNDQVDEKRELWRDRYVQQKELIASLERQIHELDLLIPTLWRDFYAWDDPVYRDSVIKVKVDEALLTRQNLEQRLIEEKPKLNEILQQARRDGAQPGWFRDIK